MTQRHVTMSQKEVGRLQVVQGVLDRRLSQAAAAGRLRLSVRQVKRLVRRYRDEGAAGLVSRRRGHRPGSACQPHLARSPRQGAATSMSRKTASLPHVKINRTMLTSAANNENI